MKKFMEIVKLQKSIEDSKKFNNQISSSTKYRNTITNNNSTMERNDFYIGRKTYEDNSNIRLSHESSISSSLNQQDFFINCYEAQKIYTTQDTMNNLLNQEIIDENNNGNVFGNFNGNNFNVSSGNKKKSQNINKYNKNGFNTNKSLNKR